jgi:hypothetical protein
MPALRLPVSTLIFQQIWILFADQFSDIKSRVSSYSSTYLLSKDEERLMKLIGSSNSYEHYSYEYYYKYYGGKSLRAHNLNSSFWLQQQLRQILGVLLVCSANFSLAIETDVVKFDNGNILIGEVQKLERGKLYFDTDAIGVVEIDWDKVTALTSSQNIQLETLTGARYLSAINFSNSNQALTIVDNDEPILMPLTDVVRMRPIESKRREQFDLSIQGGAKYDKGSDVTQIDFGLDVEYRSAKRYLELNLSSNLTDNNDETTERQDLELNFQALRDDRWFTGGLFKLQRNEELDLDLRTSVGAGIGRTFIDTGSHQVQVLGGLLLNRENFSGTGGSGSNVEGLVTVSYDWFRFSTPELDVRTSLSLFPGITDSGRFRGEFELRFRWELVEDLFWELDFYNNYDNEAENENDYGTSTSVGYKF